MKEYISYTRVSTQKQGLGLEAQAAIIVAYVKSNGGTIIATGTDREGIMISGNGILTINRGSVTATGAFGVNLNNQGTLTQNGGTLSATGSGIYNAGISNVNATLNILGGTFSATGTDGAYGIYADASDADGMPGDTYNPQAYTITHKKVTSKTVLKLKMARCGGFAISLRSR